MTLLSCRSGVTAGLMLLPLLALITGMASCSRSPTDRAVELRFEAGGSDGTNRTVLRNLQFYVHDVELLDGQGSPHPLRFVPEAPWAAERVALLDLAGAAGTTRRTVLRGKVRSAAGTKFSAVRFTVGVPFELNHANQLTAAIPLDRGDLFWTWQAGYKFMRADAAIDGREWSFHLGSTGCVSASAVRPPQQPCAQPNRVRVELHGDPLRGAIRFQSGPLAAAARAAGYVICTGNYAHDAACAGAYAATGLVPASGSCPDGTCMAQALWKLE